MNNNRLYNKYKKRLNIFSTIIFSLTLILIFNFFIVQVIFSNSYKDIKKSIISCQRLKGIKLIEIDINAEKSLKISQKIDQEVAAILGI